RVLINVVGRMHPSCDDYWDGNWLTSPIEVVAGGHSARIAAGLRAEELRSFREQLDAVNLTLHGEASLESMEQWIGLRVTIDESGHLLVTGETNDEPSVG